MAPLTVTALRERSVDMTTPFMQTGLSFILHTDAASAGSSFGVMSPFSRDTWIGVCVAFLLTAFCMFLIGRSVFLKSILVFSGGCMLSLCKHSGEHREHLLSLEDSLSRNKNRNHRAKHAQKMSYQQRVLPPQPLFLVTRDYIESAVAMTTSLFLPSVLCPRFEDAIFLNGISVFIWNGNVSRIS